MRIIGHRGAKGLAPENTIASLRKALEHQVDEIEVDVRLSGDGKVILHHDAEIVDASGAQLKIKECSFQQLKAHKPDLTTLDKAVKAVNRAVPIVVEVKPGQPTVPIIKIIRYYLKQGWQPKDFLLGSFSQKALLELQTALPDVEKVVNEKWSGVRATYRARQLGTKRLAMNQRWLWRGFIGPMAQRGWQLSAYTMNDTAKAKRWASYGLYGVITDYPDRFQK